MKRILILTLIGILLLVTACSGSSDDAEDEQASSEHVEDMDEHEDEHQEDMDEDDHEDTMDHMHVDPPDDFASMTNPFEGDEEAHDAGQEIYETNCVTCHGPEGAGDGEGAVGLDPQPANLSDHEMMDMLTDGYLFWRVTKGGAIEPFNSAMPSWEQTLTEEQRWQVISYVRSFSEH